MLVRTLLATALMAGAVSSPAASAQQTPSRSSAQLERATRSRTVMSPQITREIRQSSLPVQEVITRPIADVAPLPDAAATAPPPAEAPADGFSAAPAPDRSESVNINMAALSERVKGIRDATVFQGGRKTVLAGSAASVELDKGDVLSVRSMDAQPVQIQANGSTQAASATLLYALDSEGVTRELALVHRTQGLSWNQADRLFMGVLLVGIVDRDHPTDQASLSKPIPVQLLSAGNALKPAELSIDQIGGRFQSVEVALADPEDPYAIRLVSPVDPDLPDASLPLRRLALVLMAPARIDALGVGEGEITVRAKNGRLRSGEPVTLYLDNGELEKRTVVAGDDASPPRISAPPASVPARSASSPAPTPRTR